MTPIKVEFDGKVFVPEEPVQLPAGTRGEIVFQPSSNSSTKSTLAQLLEVATMFPDDKERPSDYAAQIDHYLYGTPKRP